MPLLKDGKPFELLLDIVEKYQVKRTYMVPESVCIWNPERKKIEVPNSWHVSTLFNGFDETGKKTTWRYYETERWDDTQKKQIYLPETFVIDGPLGFTTLGENNYDLHYFLELHPENAQNPKREKHYVNVGARFRVRDLSSSGRLFFRNADRMKHLFDRIMPDRKHSWDENELIRAMETIVTDRPPIQIPFDLLNYVEYKDIVEKCKDRKIPANREKIADLKEGMSGALFNFAQNNTAYCYELFIIRERQNFIGVLDKLISDPSIGVKFDEVTRQLTNDNTKIAANKIILTIPSDKEYEKYNWKEAIAKMCESDKKLKNMIYNLAGIQSDF